MMDVCVDGCMDGCIDGWMDMMDGWMGHVFIEVSFIS